MVFSPHSQNMINVDQQGGLLTLLRESDQLWNHIWFRGRKRQECQLGNHDNASSSRLPQMSKGTTMPIQNRGIYKRQEVFLLLKKNPSLNEKKKNRLSLNKYYQLTNKASTNNWRSILLETLRPNHKHLFKYIKNRKPAKEAVGPLDHKCVKGLLREIDCRKPELILCISMKQIWDKFPGKRSLDMGECLKN